MRAWLDFDTMFGPRPISDLIGPEVVTWFFGRGA
jgi:hypothetical protein